LYSATALSQGTLTNKQPKYNLFIKSKGEMLMKHAVGLPLLIIAIIVTLLAIFLSQTTTSSQIYAQSAYPPPESSALSLPPYPYPAPGDVIVKPSPIPTEKVILVQVSIDVTVEGLENRDSVELQMIADTDKTASKLQTLGINLPKISFQNESKKIATSAIPVGTYKLMVFSPDTYFREPQGYLFQVTETGIVNHTGIPFLFKLIPPSAQDLLPCRDTMVKASPSSSDPVEDIPFEEPKVICRAERLIDVSSPPKQPERPEEVNGVFGSGYHYAGPHTFQDNRGVWGRNYVVDPNVDHSGTSHRFVVERVYANDNTYNKWMEAGWAENWSRDDWQYIYEYDTATNTWHYFDQFTPLVGSPVETEVYYNLSINKWRALYHLGGSYWAVLAEESLGFTTADNGFNRGEVYTDDNIHPILPPSNFDLGYLLIGDVWRAWDTRYLTFVDENQPYQCEMINQYYRFTIHSPLIFLPLVARF
jgi:hypothetical protein